MVGVLLGNARREMAEYDLTAKTTQYLDRHLAFPLMAFLEAEEGEEQVSERMECGMGFRTVEGCGKGSGGCSQ